MNCSTIVFVINLSILTINYWLAITNVINLISYHIISQKYFKNQIYKTKTFDLMCRVQKKNLWAAVGRRGLIFLKYTVRVIQISYKSVEKLVSSTSLGDTLQYNIICRTQRSPDLTTRNIFFYWDNKINVCLCGCVWLW